MTYALAKEEMSSKKIFLVKITLSLNLTQQYFTFMPFPNDDVAVFELDKKIDVQTVYMNYDLGLYTRVYTIPGLNQYWYDEDNDLLYVYTTSGDPDVDLRTYIVDYSLYFTTGGHQILGSDPALPYDNIRQWEDRIIGEPSFGQSIVNFPNGIVSVSISNISIVNTDFYLNKYVSRDDSWDGKQIEVWHMIDSVSNVKKVFDGLTSGVSIDRNVLNVEVRDKYDSLRVTAFMDSVYQYYETSVLLGFTSVDPDKDGSPIRYFIGKSTKNNVVSFISHAYLEENNMFAPVNIDYNVAAPSSTNNRDWCVGLVGPSGPGNISYVPATIFSTLLVPFLYDVQIFCTYEQILQVQPNDYMHIATVGFGSGYGEIVQVNRPGLSFTLRYNSGGAVGTFVGSTVTYLIIPQVWLDQDALLYKLNPATDYTSSSTATSDGNKLIKLILNDNFEPGVFPIGVPTFTPETDKIYVRMNPGISDANHSDVVKMLVEKAGLSTDAVSFAQAKIDLDSDVLMSIPTMDEEDFGTFEKYLGQILKSAFSFIYLDNNLDFGYKVFSSPVATNEITDIEIVDGSFSINVNQDDLATRFIFYNIHDNTNDVYTTSSLSDYDGESERMNGKVISEKFVHVLEDITTRVNVIKAFRSKRRDTYNLEVKGTLLDSKIGDDILIKTSGLLGQTDSIAVKIISVDNNSSSTKISAIDLDDL